MVLRIYTFNLIDYQARPLLLTNFKNTLFTQSIGGDITRSAVLYLIVHAELVGGDSNAFADWQLLIDFSELCGGRENFMLK